MIYCEQSAWQGSYQPNKSKIALSILSCIDHLTMVNLALTNCYRKAIMVKFSHLIFTSPAEGTWFEILPRPMAKLCHTIQIVECSKVWGSFEWFFIIFSSPNTHRATVPVTRPTYCIINELFQTPQNYQHWPTSNWSWSSNRSLWPVRDTRRVNGLILHHDALPASQ